MAIAFRVLQDALPDYDGDAKADIAVFRDGVWYLLRSSDSEFAITYFGVAGDVPLESVYAP